jgi:hypothetical protein
MKNEEREFRLRPQKPPSSNARRESAAWSVAFKAVLHQARMSRNQKSAGLKVSSLARKSFHQRCAVRVTYSPNNAKGLWRAPGRYIARDSATQLEEMGLGAFNDKSDALEMTAVLDGWQRFW